MNPEQIRAILVEIERIATDTDNAVFWQEVHALSRAELTVSFADNRAAGLVIWIGRVHHVRLYRSGCTFFIIRVRLDAPPGWGPIDPHFQGLAADIYEQAKAAFAAEASAAPT